MIDSDITTRLALRDFGETVTVTPQAGDPFTVTMIRCGGMEDTRRTSSQSPGISWGAVDATLFQCAPETAALLSEGDRITCADGSVYDVYEIVPRYMTLTDIRVVEP